MDYIYIVKVKTYFNVYFLSFFCKFFISDSLKVSNKKDCFSRGLLLLPLLLQGESNTQHDQNSHPILLSTVKKGSNTMKKLPGERWVNFFLKEAIDSQDNTQHTLLGQSIVQLMIWNFDVS